MLTRRNLLRQATVLPVAAAFGPVALGSDQDDPEQTAVRMMTAGTERAIDRGLKFLAQRQQEDGSFGARGYSRNVGVCALCGLAFMAGGSTPGRGPYGAEVRRGLKLILENTQPSGFINIPETSSHGPMYGHGFATLFLAQAYGMSQQAELREKLVKAVKLIVNTQNREGGWRYHPQPRDADVSVTVCQIMALRAARNAGFHVPNETIDRCVQYVKQSQNPDGGFRYMLQGGPPSAFPRSAAGLVALYSAGIYEGPEITRGIKYLMNFRPRAQRSRRESHYFYAHYYAVQAMWQAGGAFWDQWYPAIRDELVARQHPQGHWMDSICREYGTAMACIILQLPNNILPIFQR
ncbi:MAG: prenyltransferase [Planctomycetales bacterium]|nr:prenyltransferase [Planctomycetales bacterium]NIM08605.1 prenyltransferase [Planctomycetales bacterium]NIN08073.1 prenyltransferase [Planctomycetales bacterium]NIN77207.1 prenyltransferase [Planctomycetales bacterium]NIO34389.1 prenyltransferase [Planctomycetales bacterium]